MPTPHSDNFSSQPRKTTLVETSLTPEQLGAHLGKTADVTILGESHTSQPTLNLQAKMFKAAKPEMLFSENPPSDQKGIDSSKSRGDFGNFYDTVHETQYQASKLKIPNKAVDVEHYESPNSSRLLLEIAKVENGLNGSLAQSLTDSASSIEARGGKIEADKIKGIITKNSPKNASEAMENFISHYDKQLPDFQKSNLREVAGDMDRDAAIANGSALAKITKVFDNIDDKQIMKRSLNARFKESDPIMAANIDRELQKLRTNNPDANGLLAVGMNHNKGIEKALEKKGYDVANVKIYTTDNPDLDRKVFQNSRPNGREDAEWIVTVYDPKDSFSKDFAKDFKIQPAEKQEAEKPVEKDKSTSQNDISPDMQRAMAQADEVMRGGVGQLAVTDLPKTQHPSERGLA